MRKKLAMAIVLMHTISASAISESPKSGEPFRNIFTCPEYVRCHGAAGCFVGETVRDQPLEFKYVSGGTSGKGMRMPFHHAEIHTLPKDSVLAPLTGSYAICVYSPSDREITWVKFRTKYEHFSVIPWNRRNFWQMEYPQWSLVKGRCEGKFNECEIKRVLYL